MKKRTKVKDKSFILDKRKDPEEYSGSFCGKRGGWYGLQLFWEKLYLGWRNKKQRMV